MAVAGQHSQLVGLLDRKQADALRELLQGLIATEIAEKVHRAGKFVDLMNGRLTSVATAHDVGVRLRWRRSPELDALTARMVELLATRPDLRLEEDEHELRSLLSARLAEARNLEPDVPYRQLVAGTLDYKLWHELTVMVQRGGGSETRLSRRTPLSEGEKKIVTYLSLFAAVAASHDALAAQQPEERRVVFPRDPGKGVVEEHEPGDAPPFMLGSGLLRGERVVGGGDRPEQRQVRDDLLLALRQRRAAAEAPIPAAACPPHPR